MNNFDNVVKEETKEHNPKWPQSPDRPYRILILFGVSESGKDNSIFNLISQQLHIGKIYIYAKDLYETKHQFSVNKQESTASKHFNDSKAFIEYSNDMDDIYRNIEDYNPNKKSKMLIASDDMIADMFNIGYT